MLIPLGMVVGSILCPLLSIMSVLCMITNTSRIMLIFLRLFLGLLCKMDNKFQPYLLAPLVQDLPDNLKTSQFQQQVSFVCSGRELEILCRITKMYAEVYADIMKEVRERYSLEIGAYDTRFSKLHRKLWDAYLNYQQLTLNFTNHE